MIIEKAGERIQSLDDWFRLAPPKKGADHWAVGRSAMTAAEVWLAAPNAVPEEISEILASIPGLDGLELDRAEPESLLAFDSFHSPRHSDLTIWAHDSRGPVAITVEAKADEPFDLVLSEIAANASARLAGNPRSNGVVRLDQLCLALLGCTIDKDPSLAGLRYQLLTAAAGTIAHARDIGSDRAILIVHELQTSRTSEAALDRNTADLLSFVTRLSGGAVVTLKAGLLYGPFAIAGTPLFRQPAALYVGKAVRRLGQSGSS